MPLLQGRGKGSGTATITCKATDGKNTYSASCDVTVSEIVPVTGVKLKNKKVTIGVGESIKLDYTVTPDDATTKAVSWRTSECPDFELKYSDADHTTAKVDHLGVVTGKKPGTVTVTIRTNEGGFTDTCEVTVINGITINPDVSGDGNTNANDAVLILQASAGSATLTEEQLAAADLNKDGKVNSNDAVLLLQYVASN